MMEPNAGTNGIVAPDNYWPALRAETAARGVWLIADEVMSAFGRCGEWFAWQRHGEARSPGPDDARQGADRRGAAARARSFSRARSRGRVEHQSLQTGLTYCGHPLSCAAGVAALAAYEDERLIERSRRMGAQLLEELRRLQSRHAVIGDVRGGHGLFAVLELVADRSHARAARALAGAAAGAHARCSRPRWRQVFHWARAATC